MKGDWKHIWLALSDDFSFSPEDDVNLFSFLPPELYGNICTFCRLPDLLLLSKMYSKINELVRLFSFQREYSRLYPLCRVWHNKRFFTTRLWQGSDVFHYGTERTDSGYLEQDYVRYLNYRRYEEGLIVDGKRCGRWVTMREYNPEITSVTPRHNFSDILREEWYRDGKLCGPQCDYHNGIAIVTRVHYPNHNQGLCIAYRPNDNTRYIIGRIKQTHFHGNVYFSAIDGVRRERYWNGWNMGIWINIIAFFSFLRHLLFPKRVTRCPCCDR